MASPQVSQTTEPAELAAVTKVWLVVGFGYDNDGCQVDLQAVFDSLVLAKGYASKEATVRQIVCTVYEETVNDPSQRVQVVKFCGATY